MDEIIKRMNGDRVSKIDCFAYRVTAAGADCTALTELDCMEHNLDMRYLGIYGVEGCAVQLFRIDHK